MSIPRSKNWNGELLVIQFKFKSVRNICVFLVLTFLFDFGLNIFHQPAAMRKGILNNDLNIQRDLLE